VGRDVVRPWSSNHGQAEQAVAADGAGLTDSTLGWLVSRMIGPFLQTPVPSLSPVLVALVVVSLPLRRSPWAPSAPRSVLSQNRREQPMHNNSLDASGGSVFRNKWAAKKLSQHIKKPNKKFASAQSVVRAPGCLTPRTMVFATTCVTARGIGHNGALLCNALTGRFSVLLRTGKLTATLTADSAVCGNTQ